MAIARCYKCQQKFAPERAAQKVCRACRTVVKPPSGVPFWYVIRDDKEYGPYLWKQMVAMAAHLQLQVEDMIRQEGAAYWVRASAMPGLFNDDTLQPVSEVIDEPAPEPPVQQEVLASPSSHPPQPAAEPVAIEHSWRVGRALTRIAVGTIVAVCFFGISSNFLPFRFDRDRPAPRDGTGEEQQEFVGRASPKKIEPSPREASKPEPVKPAPVEVKPESGSPTEWTERLLAQWNQQRVAAGLDRVTLHAGLSSGCTAHARYLARNVEPRQASGNNVYVEDSSKPEYSAAGEKAARVALVLYGKPARTLDVWMSRLFSRLQLLSPELQVVGIGFAPTANGEVVCVVDAMTGRTDAPVAYPVAGEPQPHFVARSIVDTLKQRIEPRALVYPCPGQQDVPCGDFDAKAEAKGFPISVTFPPGKTLRNIRVSMTDGQGHPVEVRVSTPRYSLGVHPVEALKAGQTYAIEVGLTVNGVDWRQHWQFTTSKSNP